MSKRQNIKGFFRENFLDWLLLSIGITLILLAIAQHFHWLDSQPSKLTVIRANSGDLSLDGEHGAKLVIVDIAGAVVKPGVYQMEDSSRINDLLIACGGLTQWADRRFIEKGLNRSQTIKDGEKIYIPYIGEGEILGDEKPQVEKRDIAGASLSPRININTAPVGDLETLPGIGFTYASAIVEYRQEKGSFSTTKDIKNVPGIGEKTFAKIKDLIVTQ